MNPFASDVLSSFRPARVGLRALALLFVLTISAFAQERTGTVTGRVSNAATGAYLEGAEVTIGGLPPVLTNREGGFTVTQVPTGPQTVRIYYTGLDIATKQMDVAAGQNAEVTIALSSAVYQLEAFTVAGEREGNAASITKQRFADNLKNVVSTDAFGNVADGNLGNFMARLPGIAGEDAINSDIIGIKIRGTPADLSSLNIDGVRSSGAIAGFSQMGDRAAMIDQIPAESIKEVEVIKAPTPDMPADSIGGTANLVTKSALDFKEDVLSYRLGGNYNTYRDTLRNVTPMGTLSYLTRLGRNRSIGMALSLSYTDTETPRDRVQTERVENNGKATVARTLDEVNTRIRAGTSLRFDYRPDRSSSVYAKFKYDYYSFEGMRVEQQATAGGARRVADYSRVSRAQIEAGTPARDSANQTAGVAPGFTDSFTEILSATWRNAAGHTRKLGRNFLGEIGGERALSGDQKIAFQATYSPSWFDSSLPTFTATMRPAIGMTIDTRENRSRPVFTQTYGPSIAFGSDLTLYNAAFTFSPQRTEEEVANLKADYEKQLTASRFTVQLKAGGSWRNQHRSVRTASPNWTFTGPDRVAGPNPATGINDDNIAQFRESEPAYGMFNNQYPRRDKFDIIAIERAANTNPEWFLPTASVTAPPNRSEITEDVYATYAQGRVQAGPLNILAGARFELTEVEAEGRYSDPRQPAVTQTTRSSDYDGIFPSVHMRYSLRPNLTARASFSTGAARPNMSDLYPTTTVSYDATGADGTVRQNAVGLRPARSKNYDLSLEYYFEPAGVLSAGWFRKDIKDFLARSTRDIESGVDNGFGGEYAGFTLSSTTNEGQAKVEGFELSYSQQLTMLPRPFNGLQLFANHTNLTTSGEYEEGASELAGFVPKITNAGLTYRWRAWETRISYRYSSSYMRGYNANAWQRNRLRPIEKYDVSFQYRIRPQLAIFVDIINVFNTWGENYTGDDSSRITVADVYGTRFSAGISGRF